MKKPEFKMPSIKVPEKLSSLVKGRAQPVFNRPVCTEQQHRVARALYIALLTLMAGVSVAVIGLKAMTLIFIEDNNDTGFMFETQDPEPIILAALPRQLYTAPAKLAIVAAVIAFCIAIAHGAFVIMDWKDGKKTQSYAFRRNAMFLHFMNSILVLFSLVSIFVTHKSTSHFREGYIMRKADRTDEDGDGIRYNRGTFDLETWSCELKTVDGAMMVREDYSKQCGIEMAGRAIMIPFVIAAFLIAGLSIAQMMKCRRDADGERVKSEDVGLEMGKFNAI